MANPARLAVDVVVDAASAAAEFTNAGDSARKFASDVEDAGRRVDNASRSAAGGAGELASSTSQAAGGLGDLAGAAELAGFDKLAGVMNIGAIAIMGITGASDLAELAMKRSAIATKAWTIVQGALNVVLSLNPIGLIVIAIAALVAGIILAYKNSETFRRIVDAAFAAVVETVKVAWDWIVRVATAVGTTLGDAFNDVRDKIQGFIDRIKSAIDWIKDLVKRIADFAIPSWLSDLVTRGGNLFSFSVDAGNATGLRVGSAGTTATTLARLRAVPVNIAVYLDGKKVAGIVQRVVDDSLNDEGARLADGGWG